MSAVPKPAESAPALSAVSPGGLYPLAREEAVDGMLVDAQHATDPHRIETTVVDEAADRLRVDAELTRDLPNAVEPIRLMVDRQDSV